jgi:class 3 adenylate cyclase/tetratricopeptide (TPR) repeat protein
VTPDTVACSRCKTANPPHAKFCLECAAPLAARCASCGTPLPASAKFCLECAHPVGAAGAGAPRLGAPDAYTPKHLADRILTSRTSLEGERKQVTVLFADLKGSMELLAERDPEEARQLLDPVLDYMMEAVHRYEGTVNQIMGDGIMALFGAPLAHEDHAVRACYAALRMQEALRRYTLELRRTHGVEVQIRVGMNSGEVVVRSIGSDLRMDYSAVGQTTHLAARMEQLASPGSIRLTASTLRLAEGWIQVKPLGPIPVKGLSEPVDVYEVISASAVRTRLQAAAARGLTRFVGRDAEMDQLRAAVDQVQHGHGQTVAVVGDPGVGKSRLFYEFIHSHRTHGWLVLESVSVSYGKASAFMPLVDLLKGYFKIDDRDDTRSVRAKVAGTMLTLDEGLKEYVPPVLWLLNALGEDQAFLSLEPAQRRQRALEAGRRLVLRESRVQPLLVVFEDLHWVDGETQAFLDGLVESLPTASILLAVNYRPEYEHGWAKKTYYRQLRIDPLRRESAEELLTTLLGEDASMTPLRALLIERTAGNPLFLEESVRSLVETRVLVGERGGYRLVKAPDTVQVPATVQAILAARIDRLPPEQKRLLQAASVVGKDVPFVLLQAVADLDADGLSAQLAQLQAGEFLYETSLFPDLEYTFKHALTHEVTYSSLLGERRRQLHAAIVEALERIHAGRLDEHVERLAHHSTRGELRGKAVQYLREAGAKAVARSANRAAVGLFEQALALLADLPPTTETLTAALDTRIAIGPALVAVHGAGSLEVETSYTRARELVDRLGDTSRRFPVLWGLWFVNYNRGEYPAARDAGERLLEAARSGDDTGRLVAAHHALWATLTAMGRAADAVVHAEHGVALYDVERHFAEALVYGGHDAGVCSRYQMAANRWLLGHPDRARADIQDSLRLAERLQHPMTQTIAYWLASWVAHQRGDREGTVVMAERLLSLVREHQFTGWSDAAVVLLPAARGDHLDRQALADLHRQLVAEPAAAWRRLLALCVLADLYAAAGLADEGLLVLGSIADRHRDTIFAPELHRLEGELLLRRSPPDEGAALRCFRRAMDLARERGEKSLELRAAMSLARLLQRQGQREPARQVLANVYGWFTEGFDTADLRGARELLIEMGGLEGSPKPPDAR